ncbi:hypothetical protein SERLADRAFT_447627 [Serpula lacrymans var. lacrymans S7.9]|uniref:Serine aminopeptidase S33 domain-containing protein n=1 Tax=Serpula lacrymans var. lacrymans (strain S7.9) TaxID=578457 RepID=F8NSB3_SERL9|nr:uncharacterized protein SERLADRAFT_447627 [Serpula lacrymans var. lacrymans S7.9]EGO26422.1 hypothetical protein SERLADRAFT_447627 [Serpula lacrymans var. lacrymans S7.9]
MSTYQESWLLGPQSTNFYTRTYPSPTSPPHAALVFIHGFIEHIARYDHVFSAFAARGITVFAYDQRGFGRTALDEGGRSKGSAYAKTSWREQLEDVEWAVGRVRRGEVPGCEGVPVFLYGHSMGGGLCLAFPTRTTRPPSPDTLSSISGIIATSPLLTATKPASKAVRWIGGKASVLAPSLTIPAEVAAEVLSHDPEVIKNNIDDPLIKRVGSLRGLSDMLDGGEKLLKEDHARWPKALPLLLIHGSDDQGTSCESTEEFYKKVTADDKTFSCYPGGYHELHNEPDGVKEKLIEECISWVEAKVKAKAAAGITITATPSSKL